MKFADRADAGRRLAEALVPHNADDVVVVALVRGGLPVAAEIAAALRAPLEVLVVRKVGAPSNPEYGIGAVAEDGHTLANVRAVAATGVSNAQFEQLAAAEMVEVARRVQRYRGDRARASFAGRAVIVVDDGLATGVTARLGIETVRRMGARTVTLAVPVGAPETVRDLSSVADAVVCLEQPPDFRAVGTWYADFTQVSDEEVVALLSAARESQHPPVA